MVFSWMDFVVVPPGGWPRTCLRSGHCSRLFATRPRPEWNAHGKTASFWRVDQAIHLLPKGVIAVPGYTERRAGSGLTMRIFERVAWWRDKEPLSKEIASTMDFEVSSSHGRLPDAGTQRKGITANAGTRPSIHVV